MITVEGLVSLVIYLIIGGLIWCLLNWLIDYCAPPEPFRKVAKIALAVLCVLVLISALLSLVGHPLVRM